MKGGSRNDRIIGFTHSGKPVYESHDHPEHETFDEYECEHAALLHSTEHLKFKTEAEKHRRDTTQYKTAYDGANHHYKQFGSFLNRARVIKKTKQPKRRG